MGWRSRRRKREADEAYEKRVNFLLRRKAQRGEINGTWEQRQQAEAESIGDRKEDGPPDRRRR